MSVNGSRVIRFAGSTVTIHYEGADAARIVEFLFRHVPDGEPLATNATYHLAAGETEELARLYRDETLLYATLSQAEMAGWLLGEVCRSLASDSMGGLVFHASALSWQGRGVMLPGTMQVGKSTLTGWLLSKGYRYLTDEMAFLSNGNACLTGFTRPLNLRRSSRFVWEAWQSSVRPWQNVVSGQDFDLVQPTLFPTSAVPLQTPLHVIIFPQYDPDASFELRQLTKAQAGLELMRHFVNARNLPEDGFPRITHLARTVPAYAMRYSSFMAIGDHIERLLQPPSL